MTWTTRGPTLMGGALNKHFFVTLLIGMQQKKIKSPPPQPDLFFLNLNKLKRIVKTSMESFRPIRRHPYIFAYFKRIK